MDQLLERNERTLIKKMHCFLTECYMMYALSEKKTQLYAVFVETTYVAFTTNKSHNVINDYKNIFYHHMTQL